MTTVLTYLGLALGVTYALYVLYCAIAVAIVVLRAITTQPLANK